MRALTTAFLTLALISFYPSDLTYPPLRSTPSMIVPFGQGSLVMALPSERSVAVYELDSGNLWRLELGFAPEGVAVSGNVALAYSRLGGAVILNLDRLTPVREVRGRIQGAWPIDGGFVVHRGAGLSRLDLDGEELRYLRVETAEGQRYISVHGKTVWFVGVDLRTIYAMDLESWEARRVASHNRMISSIAALSEETVAVASEGWIGTYRINGESRSFDLPYQTSSNVILFPAKAGRVIFIDETKRAIGLLGSGVRWHSFLEITPTLVTSPSPSRVFVFDTAQGKLNYYDMRFKPEITDVKLEVRGGPSVYVEATVRDMDGDLLSYSPSAAIRAGNGSIVFSPMRSIGGDRFAATVDLRGFSGDLEITVTASDVEGNQAESQPYRLSVGRDRVVVGTPPTPETGTTRVPQQTGTSMQLTDLLVFSVELAFFAVLVMSLVLIALRSRRRGRKRAKRG
ncbi:MAG: hypothetical protein RMJ75_02330 [Nitrososphaerota archaeon]|nr:hypothetical protein [Nitrososphaerota archaeon]